MYRTAEEIHIEAMIALLIDSMKAGNGWPDKPQLDMMHRAVSDMIPNLVQMGALEVAVNEEGQMVYSITDFGRQLKDDLEDDLAGETSF